MDYVVQEASLFWAAVLRPHAALALRGHSALRAASFRKATACARKVLFRILAVVQTNAALYVTPTRFLRLTEPLNARFATRLPIFSRPVGHHPASILNAGKLVPIKLQLVPIAEATATTAI